MTKPHEPLSSSVSFEPLRTLVRLLARQAARECLVVPSSLTAAVEASAIHNPTLKEEGTRNE
jgi:hypothetical protein